MPWTGTALENAVATSQRIALRTQRLYLKRVQEFIGFAGQYPHQWTTARLEAWRDYLLHKRGLKPQTVNLYLSAVRFAAKRANELGAPVNFARGAESARKAVSTESPRVLSPSEIKRLLATCTGDAPPDVRDRAMILTGIGCAFRRAELCGITFDAVRGRQIRVIAKGQRMHVVACPPQAWEALHVWTAWLHSQGIRDGYVFRSLRDTVDGWKIGAGMTPDGWAKALRKRAADANLKGVHAHTLRHTYASIALNAGVPAWKVKKVLGHKTDIMLDRYAHDLDPHATADEFPHLGGE